MAGITGEFISFPLPKLAAHLLRQPREAKEKMKRSWMSEEPSPTIGTRTVILAKEGESWSKSSVLPCREPRATVGLWCRGAHLLPPIRHQSWPQKNREHGGARAPCRPAGWRQGAGLGMKIRLGCFLAFAIDRTREDATIVSSSFTFVFSTSALGEAMQCEHELLCPSSSWH